MDVRLVTMRLENFKGISALEIDMGGHDTAVYGANATGKTTLFDAFTWCLFGKDSSDRSDFWVKPHDASGDEIHNLETVVELGMTVDGRDVVFRHSVSENWVKQNGQTDRVYSGNTHKYWVNGVGKTAGEYTKEVGQIVNPDVFRLITNPMAFNAVKWEKRREFLLKLSSVDVDAIMLERPQYERLRELMTGHGTDIYGVKKVIQEKRRIGNDELNQIPVRISEQTNTRNALGTCDVAAAKARMAEIAEEIAKIDEAMRDGSGAAEELKAKTVALTKAQAALQSAMREIESARNNARMAASSELASARAKVSASEVYLKDAEARLSDDQAEVARLEQDLQAARDEWRKVDGELPPEHSTETVCPTCGQPLPADQIEAAERQFMVGFEKDKERRLEAINRNGQAVTSRLKALKERIEQTEKSIAQHRASIAEQEPRIEGLKAEAKSLEGTPDFDSNESILRLRETVRKAEEDLNETIQGQKPVDEGLTARKNALAAERYELAGVEAKQAQIDICNTRIAQLETRQSELGAQIADAERLLMLIDQFITERCGLLEQSINSLFPTVRWLLFEKQINGGMRDTCVCLIGGVQFSDANNAARINAGLEIIGVLSKHYGVSVPVFVDNAEAVNHLQPMDAQRIALVVTADDDTLRIERI